MDTLKRFAKLVSGVVVVSSLLTLGSQASPQAANCGSHLSYTFADLRRTQLYKKLDNPEMFLIPRLWENRIELSGSKLLHAQVSALGFVASESRDEIYAEISAQNALGYEISASMLGRVIAISGHLGGLVAIANLPNIINLEISR